MPAATRWPRCGRGAAGGLAARGVPGAGSVRAGNTRRPRALHRGLGVREVGADGARRAAGKDQRGL